MTPISPRQPSPSAHRSLLGTAHTLILAIGLIAGSAALAQTNPVPSTPPAEDSAATTRLRQTQPQLPQEQRQTTPPHREANPRATDFEDYVRRVAGGAGVAVDPIRRFGAELFEQQSADESPSIPADYALKPGDELLINAWGSVDADLRLTIDRSGRVQIPRVGPVLLSGVRYGDAGGVIRERMAKVFKNFDVSVSLGRLRGMRVFVTGFVERPGAITVSSLSTISNLLVRAGGPTGAGSLRNIQLRRGKELLASFDYYELLLKGDRLQDRLLQPDDVVHIGPVGAQVGLIGSVNRPGIFELKPGESLADAIAMAGGFTAVGDRRRVAVERLSDRATVRIVELALPERLDFAVENGDVIRAFNATTFALPMQQQNKRVRIEGEVTRPGEYLLPPSSTLRDAVAKAGGLTAAAFLYGADFTRDSVRTTQVENYERALRDLESDLARDASSQRTNTADEASVATARNAASARLIERLRAVRPTGRVVLELQRNSKELPALELEDGDRLYVPPTPTTVGVFGSVFNAGSYLFRNGSQIADYLKQSGGPTRGADKEGMFIVHANGSVSSNLQVDSGWFRGNADLSAFGASPGDTVFVPEQMNKMTFTQHAKDWTQIVYQLGLGVLGLKALGL